MRPTHAHEKQVNIEVHPPRRIVHKIQTYCSRGKTVCNSNVSPATYTDAALAMINVLNIRSCYCTSKKSAHYFGLGYSQG